MIEFFACIAFILIINRYGSKQFNVHDSSVEQNDDWNKYKNGCANGFVRGKKIAFAFFSGIIIIEFMIDNFPYQTAYTQCNTYRLHFCSQSYQFISNLMMINDLIFG